MLEKSETCDSIIFEQMIEFVEAASSIALKQRELGLQISHKGNGLGQSLTQTDLEISEMLLERFGSRVIEEETAHLISYEDVWSMLAEEQWSFIADPIDGTKPFASGLPGWGTMIAACRRGWPVMSVLGLPAWYDDRTMPASQRPHCTERGILIAAYNDKGFWAPTRGGRRVDKLQPFEQRQSRTNHIAWQPGLAQRYTLDYESGLFPWCESSSITEAALIATGRLDATPLNSSLWDTAPLLPVLRARGLNLYRWPDLQPPTPNIMDLVDRSYSGRNTLWLACFDKIQAHNLSNAIRYNPNWRHPVIS